MIHLHLTTNQDAYGVVGDIIEKEAEKVFGNYNPCAFIVKLGYKYEWESESERIIENEYYYNNDLNCYWENDWHEGQTDIIVYGFTTMEEVDVKHEITEEKKMQRLIDANAFLERTSKDPLFPLVERYGLSGVIEHEPTVEAIPVEWLLNHIPNDSVMWEYNRKLIEHLVIGWREENETAEVR